MKNRLFYVLIFLLVNSFINAQPSNDDPCNAIALDMNATCSFSNFTTTAATTSVGGVPSPGCGTYTGGDVWFSITMPNNGFNTVIELSADVITDAGVAVYSGDCSALTLVDCDDNSGIGSMPKITIEDGCTFGDAGATFYIRVWENGNDNNGTFDICAYTAQADNPAGVVACSTFTPGGNTCCDAIMPGFELDGYCGNTGSYTPGSMTVSSVFCGNIENNSWLAFIASDETVSIDFSYSNCNSDLGIQVDILGTDDCVNFTAVSNGCWNPLPGSATSGNITAENLTVGETYYIMVDGWGGDACDYFIDVISGIDPITVTVSDDEICAGDNVQLGIEIIGAGPFNYAWTPAVSLSDPTIANPVATPTSSTIYTVHVTGALDTMITIPISVISTVPNAPVVMGPDDVCKNTTGHVYSTNDVSTYSWSITGGGTIVGPTTDQSVTVNWGATGGDVCLTNSNACGSSTQTCYSVTTSNEPDISVTNPSATCEPLDLATLTVNDAASSGGDVSYHTSQADAQAGTPELASSIVSTSGTYWIRMYTSVVCYDVTSVNVTIEQPSIVVVDPPAICAPNTIDLSSVIITESNGSTGTRTYYADSLAAVAATPELVSSVVTTSGTYWVRYELSTGCFVAAPIEVEIDPAPSVTVQQPNPICTGQSVDLDTVTLVNINGAVIANYLYYDNPTFANLGAPFPEITSTIVNTAGTYYVRSETAQGCFSVAEINIVQDTEPAASISGGGTYCPGDDIELMFNITGTGPFDLVYSDGTTPSTLIGINDGHIETLSVTGDQTFTLVSVVNANGCTGTTVGTVSFTEASTLEATNIVKTCDISYTNYTVEFTITGGTAPYTVTGGAGTVTGNTFESNPIPNGTAYSFEVTDANNCTPYTAAGTHNCSCSTDAGTMNTTLLEACVGESIIAVHNGDENLSTNDILLYALHTDAGASLGTIFSISASPTFSLEAGMTAGTTYYISAIAGIDDGTGSIDQSHICFSVAAGTPIVFNALPEASISGGGIYCPGVDVEVTFNITGTGPFDVMYSGDSNTMAIGIDDGHVQEISMTGNQTINLVSVLDANSCAGTVAGMASFTEATTPEAINIVKTCDNTFTNYTVEFSIMGGTAPYTVVGGGTITGSTFVSDPIPNGTAYSFEITDANNCTPYITAGTQNCSCSTDAGSMVTAPLVACVGETITAPHNGDEILDSNDLLMYALHTDAGPTLGTIFSINASPSFGFESGMVVGTTYYISAIAGIDDGTGNIDQSQICFSVAAGTPVVFQELPEATISGEASICVGEDVPLTINFTGGIAPFDVIISIDATTTDTILGISDGFEYTVSPSVTTTYTILSVTDQTSATCAGTTSGSATVSIEDAPVAGTVSYICNNTNTAYQVRFEITGGDPSTYTVTGDPGTIDNTSSVFTSEMISSGSPYSFEVNDAANCAPYEMNGNYACDCSTFSGSVNSTGPLLLCEDDIASINSNGDAVLDGNDVLAYVVHDASNNVLGNVMLISNDPNFAYDPILSYNQTYYISAVVGDDDGVGLPILDVITNPCLSVSPGIPVTFTQTPEVAIIGGEIICVGDTVDISFSFNTTGLFDVVYFDGISNDTLTGISDGHIEQVVPSVSTTYSLVGVSTNGVPMCEGLIDPVNDFVYVEILDRPVAVNVEASCNEAATFYYLTFDLEGGDTLSYMVNGGAGTLIGGTFTSEAIPVGDVYTYLLSDASGCPAYELTGTFNCNCTADIKPLINIEQPIGCGGDTNGTLSVENINGEAPFNFEWSTGDIGTQISDIPTGWYHVTMTDGNNCESQDSIFLTEPTPIQADLVATVPSCYGEDDASISFTNISGGTGNFEFAIGNNMMVSDSTFYYFPAGAYVGTIMDDAGCTWEGNVAIENPSELYVDLGDDVTINLGDSIELNAFINQPVDTFFWWPQQLMPCEGCLNPVVTPNKETLYRFTAINENGCSFTEEIMVWVQNEFPVFIPTAFTPNGDGNNDRFMLYGGTGITMINAFRIFDRWGALLYEENNVSPGDETQGWDGAFRGKKAPSGVYIYYFEVQFSDGRVELFRGDITLVR